MSFQGALEALAGTFIAFYLAVRASDGRTFQ